MANVSTINNNILIDSGVGLLEQPPYPYPELQVTGTLAPPFTARNVFGAEYFKYCWSYPAVGKSYPSTSSIYNAYGDPFTISSVGVGATTHIKVPNVQSIVSTNIAALSIGANISGLVELEFPDLVYFLAGVVAVPTVGSVPTTLTTVKFPELQFIAGGFTIPAGNSITSYQFPKVEVIGGLFTNQSLNLQSINLPEAVYVTGISDTTNSSIQSISLPKVKVMAGSLNLTGTKASLTTIDLSSIEYITGITFPTTATSLTTVNFGSNLKAYGTSTTNLVTTSNSLNQASVDNILISLAALDGTNGTTAFSNRTITITGGSATPSAAGLAAKATLQARGCTVTTN